MATTATAFEDPKVKTILRHDKANIEELEGKVEVLKDELGRAHLKATHRRLAIKGLERRCEHLEHLLSAARGDSERLNKEQYATATLVKMCHGDAFAAFDAILEYAFKGRIDELRVHMAQLDTEWCDAGCGEWLPEMMHYTSEGVPLCRTCRELGDE